MHYKHPLGPDAARGWSWQHCEGVRTEAGGGEAGSCSAIVIVRERISLERLEKWPIIFAEGDSELSGSLLSQYQFIHAYKTANVSSNVHTTKK